MADIEKVIKGLECCTKWNSCSDCPYQTPNEYDVSECTEQMHKDTIELLKEQEAVKPMSFSSGGWLDTKTLWKCGSCGARISKRKTRFCQECGMPVLWEGR